MSLVLLLFAIAAAIWCVYLSRKTSIILQCFGVIVTGAVIGHAFYHVSVGPIPITIDRVLFLLVMVQFGVFVFARRVEILKNTTRVDMLVFALLLTLTFSTFMGDYKYKDNLSLGRLLFFNLMPIAMYFVVRHSELRKVDLHLLFGGLSLFGIYLSVTAIGEVVGPSAIVFPKFILSPEHAEFLGRARGPLLNPVSCGIYQVVCLSAAMMFWPISGKAGKTIILLIAPLFLVGIFLTLTRSIWLTAMWAAMIVCWIPADLKYRTVMASMVIVLGMVGFVFLGDRLDGFKRDKHVTAHEMAQSAKLRPMLAVVALRMFQDRPLFGCGFGQYTKYKKPYHYEEGSELPLRAVLPYMQHNVLLSYLTETGLLGITLLLSILSGFSIQGWRLWRDRCRSLAARQIGLMMLVVISSYLINGMFHDVSIIPMMGILLFYFGGLTANLKVNRMMDEGVEERNEAHSIKKWDTAPAQQAA